MLYRRTARRGSPTTARAAPADAPVTASERYPGPASPSRTPDRQGIEGEAVLGDDRGRGVVGFVELALAGGAHAKPVLVVRPVGAKG